MLVVDAHVVHFCCVYWVLTFSFIWFKEFPKLLIDVFKRLILLDPFVKFAFNLFSINIPSLVDLIILLLILIDSSSSIFHPDLILKLFIDIIFNIMLSHSIFPELHFHFCFSSGNIILLNFFIINTLMLIVIKLGNDFVILLLILN